MKFHLLGTEFRLEFVQTHGDIIIRAGYTVQDIQVPLSITIYDGYVE